MAAILIESRGVTLDLVTTPPEAQHLLDDEALAATGICETAVEDRNPARSARAGSPPATEQQQAQQPQHQGISSG
jgi:hypothetical protein